MHALRLYTSVCLHKAPGGQQGPWQQQLAQASSQERPGDAPTLRCSLTCEGSTLAPRAKVAFPSPTDALLLAKQ